MFYLRVTFLDGTHLYQDNLTRGQAVYRYNKWLRNFDNVQEVTFAAM